jgi:methionyl aminopeptidase
VGKKAPKTFAGSDVYSAASIDLIRESSVIAAQAIQAVGRAVRPGITTDELDAIGHDFVVAAGAYPSCLGYRGFPKSVCTSLNEVICHGIPDDTVLQDGDIINIDITAYKNGVHGDSNVTFLVGDVSAEVVDLVERTRESLNRGIKAVAPGRQVNVIGRAIESYARRFDYGVVRDFTGHGVGEAFHSGLIIPHYDSAPRFDDEIVQHMVFTIEPMLTLGGSPEWDMWADGWTVVTKDRSVTAQFEHTLVVTERGADVLTIA